MLISEKIEITRLCMNSLYNNYKFKLRKDYDNLLMQQMNYQKNNPYANSALKIIRIPANNIIVNLSKYPHAVKWVPASLEEDFNKLVDEVIKLDAEYIKVKAYFNRINTFCGTIEELLNLYPTAFLKYIDAYTPIAATLCTPSNHPKYQIFKDEKINKEAEDLISGRILLNTILDI